MDKELEVLKSVSGVVTQEPVRIEITVLPRTAWHERLQRWKWTAMLFPRTKAFDLQPISLGSLVRISKILLSINFDMFSGDNFIEGNYELIKAHGREVAEVVAIAIANSKKGPDEKLIDFLFYNLSPKELLSVLVVIRRGMSIESFTLATGLMKGMNVLERKEKREEGEPVAEQTN